MLTIALAVSLFRLKLCTVKPAVGRVSDLSIVL